MPSFGLNIEQLAQVDRLGSSSEFMANLPTDFPFSEVSSSTRNPFWKRQKRLWMYRNPEGSLVFLSHTASTITMLGRIARAAIIAKSRIPSNFSSTGMQVIGEDGYIETWTFSSFPPSLCVTKGEQPDHGDRKAEGAWARSIEREDRMGLLDPTDEEVDSMISVINAGENLARLLASGEESNG
jgi:hypothetical protein